MPKQAKSKAIRPKTSRNKVEADDSKFMLKEFKHLHMRAVENTKGSGTPDLTYVHGWIELKRIQEWPARQDTPLKIGHFTADQRRWLRDRCDAGGNAFMLLHVDHDWLLIHGAVAARIVGKASRQELLAHCVWMSLDGFDKTGFADALRG
jgi:hypothetical protein